MTTQQVDPSTLVPTGLYDRGGNLMYRAPRSAPSVRRVNMNRAPRRVDNYLVNQHTGMGVRGRDKSLGIYTVPIYINDQEAENIYLNSALAAKVVNIPVEDALMRWRTFEGQNAEYFKQVEKYFQVKKTLVKAAQDARVYGTAVVVMRLADNAWSEPLNLNAVHPGMLKGLTVVDKRAISNVQIDQDLLSPTYGEPYMYDITFPRTYQTHKVHASRVLRFDGIVSNSTRDFYRADRWGLGTSVFVRLAESLDTLASSLQSLKHLETEAGMPVFGLQNFEDTISQIESGSGEVSAYNKLEMINENRSVYGMTVMSADDLYQRLDVSFAGRAPLLVEYRTMLSAAADIPMTRLFGQSPGGLNATGESDAQNYAVKIAEIQESDYGPVILQLDAVLAMVSGLGEPPQFTWEPLLDLSETEQIANRAVEIESMVKAHGSSFFTVPEVRFQLSKLKGLEWVSEVETPAELVAPPPPAEEANPEMMLGPGMAGLAPPEPLPGGGPGAPPALPPALDEGMAPLDEAPIIEGEFLDEGPMPAEVLAAAIENDLAEQDRQAGFGFRDYADF